MGTLLEDTVDGYVLTGDAVQTAARATSGRDDGSGPSFSKRAPAKPVVDSARRELVAYAHTHPSGGLPVAGAATGRSASSASGGTTATSSSPSSTSHRQDGDGPSLVERLPPGNALMAGMMNDPTMGPVAVGRLGPAGASFGGGGSGGSRGGSPGGTAWTASRGGSASPSVAAAHTSSRRVSGGSSSSSSHHSSSGSGHSSSSHHSHR